MQNRRTENEVRITEIARLIDELSTELNQLLLLEDQTQDTTQLVERRREIIVGDTVEITNDYRNQLGERGIVTKVTRAQVTLTLNSTGRSIRKKKTNVRLVLPTEQDLQQEQ
jgi:transcription elongation factor